MRQLLAVRRFLRQPLTMVAGVLVSGAAAKLGYGGWGAGLMLASLPVYLSVVATAILTHRLGSLVESMQERHAHLKEVPASKARREAPLVNSLSVPKRFNQQSEGRGWLAPAGIVEVITRERLTPAFEHGLEPAFLNLGFYKSLRQIS